jgi:hypothetical protein
MADFIQITKIDDIQIDGNRLSVMQAGIAAEYTSGLIQKNAVLSAQLETVIGQYNELVKEHKDLLDLHTTTPRKIV